ncbi:hypothetical protein ANN_05822 [Periplaneta americana]|uniref:Uncharacterized protein n=1 Tax=Periplaneta americana TaxID=6978 RepID=A0ABQ8TDM1_PERAM|nr:hypothetical protein ANN_05822 [Periplaneta americana]
MVLYPDQIIRRAGRGIQRSPWCVSGPQSVEVSRLNRGAVRGNAAFKSHANRIQGEETLPSSLTSLEENIKQKDRYAPRQLVWQPRSFLRIR